MKTAKLTLIAAAAFFAAEASAVPMWIDFTDARWSGVEASSDGSFTESYGGLEVTVTAGGALSFNAHEAPGTGLSDLGFQGDGLGVGDDEIGLDDVLDVSFGSSVTVLSVALLDLFDGEGPEGAPESAQIWFDGGFHAADGTNDAAGWYLMNGLEESTTQVSFTAGLQSTSIQAFGDGAGQQDTYSDFSLAGILIDTAPPTSQAVQVPEPMPLGLLAVGSILLGLGARRRAPTS